MQEASMVAQRHFDAALANVRPGLTPAMLQRYAAWQPHQLVQSLNLPASSPSSAWPMGEK